VTREILPDRRPSVTVTVEWNGHSFPVTIGFDPATGRPCEVFADVSKGDDVQRVASDACVWASLGLQWGMTPADLAKSLGRVPSWQGEVPASPLGAVVEAIMQEAKG
jgi:hypothetical protein